MIINKIASSIATGALLFSMVTPAFAADTIEISGNGAGSLNTAVVTESNNTNVSQSNTANVTNNVTSSSNSGGNNANFNTGGNTSVQTGGAQSVTNVSTAVNANIADVDPCACVDGDLDVKISGNGADSYNNAAVAASNTTTLKQANSASVTNKVESKANSGRNDADFNTGGSTSITTGPAVTLTSVLTAGNVNSATVGGNGLGVGNGNAASALITGNGAGSVNGITLYLPSALTVSQANSASVMNYVESKANSGKNDANFNTGGITQILTGGAAAKTNVDNLLNFNSANLDCDCLVGGVNAKIAGNGASGSQVGTTYDTILATVGNTTVLGQGNGATLENNADAKAKSGYNDADYNVGSVYGDPSVMTGQTYSETNVSTLSNWNGAATGTTVNLPGGTSLNLLMDLSLLMAWLHV